MRTSSLGGTPQPTGQGPGSGTLPRLTGPSSVVAILVLAAVCIPLFFVGLGASALLDPDEPYYAVPAREMLDAGEWKIPLFRGEPWFDKPILFYWVVLAAYHVMGVGEAAARIGSALAALGGVLALWSLARKLKMPPRAAFISALVLATSLGYVVVARAAITDMTLTLFLVLGMLAVAHFLETRGAFPAYLAGAAFGLATLTKGPVGVLVPAVALVPYALLGFRRDLFRPRPLLLGVAGLLTTAAPWYAYMATAHRDLLLGSFLEQGNLGRFLHPEHRTFAFYYAVVLGAGLLPWAGAFPLALWQGLREALRDRRLGRASAALYPICWFGAILLIFALSASKLPSYVLPAYPAAALLIGSYWHRAFDPVSAPAGGAQARLSAWLGVGIAVAALAAMIPEVAGHGWRAMQPTAVLLGSVLVTGALAGVAAVHRRSPGAYLACGTATTLVSLVVLLAVALPRLEPFESTRPMVRDLEAAGLADEVHSVFRVKDVSLEYYLGRDLLRVPSLGQLRRQVAASPGELWVIRTGDLETLRSAEGIVTKEVVHGPHRSVVRISPASAPEGDVSQ